MQNDVNQRFVKVGLEHRTAATGNTGSYYRLGYERSKLEGRNTGGGSSVTTSKSGTWTLPQVQRGTNVTIASAQRHVRDMNSRGQVAKALPTAAPGTTNRVVARPSSSIPRTPGASTVNPRPGTSSNSPSRVTIGGSVNGNSRLPSRPGTSPSISSRTPSGSVPSRVNPSSPRPTVPKPSVSPRPSVPRPSVPSPRPSVSPRPRPSAPSPRPSVTPSVPRPSAPSPRPSVSPRPRPSAPSPRPSVAPSAPRPSAPSPRPSVAPSTPRPSAPAPRPSAPRPSIPSPRPS